jgi:hypothetical protein
MHGAPQLVLMIGPRTAAIAKVQTHCKVGNEHRIVLIGVVEKLELAVFGGEQHGRD